MSPDPKPRSQWRNKSSLCFSTMIPKVSYVFSPAPKPLAIPSFFDRQPDNLGYLTAHQAMSSWVGTKRYWSVQAAHVSGSAAPPPAGSSTLARAYLPATCPLTQDASFPASARSSHSASAATCSAPSSSLQLTEGR
jgi:hypothetical protein